MRFFVTGHTGFKGSWLCVILNNLGHEVHGYSLSPEPGGLFEEIEISSKIKSDRRGDIRNKDQLVTALKHANPDVVIHLAAQPLVRESYSSPSETFETNCQGTVNLIHAMSEVAPDAFLLAITTDKVYKNTGKLDGYVESDELGAADPYSASKAMADFALQSWAYSFPDSPRLAIARAGNVIGPYDSSRDRIVPDILRSATLNKVLSIRSPESTRPWQHVLDCLFGYLLLVDKYKGTRGPVIWNFGPLPENERSVFDLVMEAHKHIDFDWKIYEEQNQKIEQKKLTLDSKQARNLLNWSDSFTFEDAIRETITFSEVVSRTPIELKWSTVSKYVNSYLEKSLRLGSRPNETSQLFKKHLESL